MKHAKAVFVCGAALAQGILMVRCASAGASEELVHVVASPGLRRGERLTVAKFSKALGMDAASAEMFLTEGDVQSSEGLFARTDIASGLPVLISELSEKPILSADVAAIPPGRVLFPLGVHLGALAPLLEPGRRVDVIAHMTLPEAGVITETLLEGATVVSVGENPAEDGRSDGDVVSFHLTPEQVKMVVYAQKFSEFHLVLRNPKEPVSTVRAQGMTLNRFLANPRIQSALASDVFLIRPGVSAGAPEARDTESVAQ